MTNEKRAKLEAVKDERAIDRDGPFFEIPSDNFSWLITELEKAWAREAGLRDHLKTLFDERSRKLLEEME